jgi:IclR family acetate operon transcriptional repressor
LSDLEKENTSPMESVDKALLALEVLSKSAEGLSLGALAAALGLKKNSLHRTLSALRYRGFVVQEGSTGNYQLGPSLLRLADEFMSGSRLRQIFHPVLQSLAGDVNELCHLGILDGTDIIHMDKIEPEQSIRVWSSIGSRSPAVTTALGRAIIAFTFEDFDGFSRKFNGTIAQRTPHTHTDWREIWAEMHITRVRGYALENEEGQEGVSCVAIPILRSGVPVLSVSVSAPSVRMSRARIGQLVASMREHIGPALPVGMTLPGLASEALLRSGLGVAV